MFELKENNLIQTRLTIFELQINLNAHLMQIQITVLELNFYLKKNEKIFCLEFAAK